MKFSNYIIKYFYSLSSPYKWLLLFFVSLGSCSKFIDVQAPKDELVNSVVFQDDKSANSALLGVYVAMMTIENTFSGNMTINCGLYADELTTANTTNEFFYSQLTTEYSEVNNTWKNIYNYIYGANAVIAGVSASSKITDSVKSQLIGEAKFIRAYGYFYLVNLYGDVPLITTTDYQTNSTISRTPAVQVYQQMIADLKDAQNLLSADYSFSNGEKIRPNKWAAAALLSRVYLYEKDWQDAIDQASAVINSDIYSLSSLDGVFLANSAEAIWQLMPVNLNYNTYEAQSFVPQSSTSQVNYPLTNTLLQAFEPGDNRLTEWIGSSNYTGSMYYYPFKYKVLPGQPITEYYMVIRLGELYLIRAEALARLNNVTDAVSDINIIRSRAGLSSLPVGQSSDQTLTAIAQERRVELFAEWGHRWFDLNRTGQANTVIGSLKLTTWKSTAVLWPVPLIQMNANPALIQNAGY